MISNYLSSNTKFDSLYTPKFQAISKVHFTPLDVALRAADYLAKNKGTKILDIGSGAGKFCLVGAATTSSTYVGVEQRKNLVTLSNKLAKKLSLDNLQFLQANINVIDFSDYDAFYFFNSFNENIDSSQAIDETVFHQEELFEDYTKYVREQLAACPVGTRLVTYWTNWAEIPLGYDLVETDFNGKLNFWEKKF